jgi:hypothetical protein
LRDGIRPRAIQFWMGLAETLVERVQHIVVIVKRV